MQNVCTLEATRQPSMELQCKEQTESEHVDGDHRKTCKSKCGQQMFTWNYRSCSCNLQANSLQKSDHLSDLEDYLPSRGFSPTKLYPSITYTTATPSNSDEFLVDRNKVLKKSDQMLHPIKYIKQEDPLPYIKDSLAYLQYNMLMTPAKRRGIMDTVPFCSLILSIIKIAMIDVNAMVICNNY